MTIRTMCKHRIMETTDLAASYLPTYTGFVQRARLALDKYQDVRAENARDPRLTDQGVYDAAREAGERTVAELSREAGGVMLNRLKKSVPYRLEQIERAVWPPKAFGDQTAAVAELTMREIRDYLRTLSDDGALTSPDGRRSSDRTKVLHQAAADGDAQLMRAVVNSPAALRLIRPEDVEHARATYISGAISRLPESQTAPLAEARQALDAFEQVQRAVEHAAGAKFDPGHRPEPEIKVVG